MRSRAPRLLFLAAAVVPFVVAVGKQTADKQEPAAEQVFKNIQAFKGMPASELIPSMEFMAASLKIECSDCHDMKDFSIDTRMKETARRMIAMQRDINAKNFNGRNQVTCMTCHRGSEKPVGTPVPNGLTLRHASIENPPKAEDLFGKHAALSPAFSAPLVRRGTLTAPSDATHKIESAPLEYIQAPGGKYSLVSGDKKVVANGTKIWYGPAEMTGEGAAIFGRIGRTWRGDDAFAGLERPTVVGQEQIGNAPVVVVRATRPATSSTEELYFDTKSGLLVRLVNIRRSPLGNVVSAIDYSNYRKVNGAMVPMRVVATYAGGEQWIMDFKTARLDPSVGASAFEPAK